VVRARPRRPGLLSLAGATPGPPGPRRAAPNTHADSGGPTPQGRAAVPGNKPRPVPILIRSRHRGHSKAAGSSPQGRGQLGTAHGRGGSSGDGSFFVAAARRGSGGHWDGASAPSPYSLRQPRADLVSSPGPPPGRRPVTAPRSAGQVGRGRRPIKASGCRGCGPGLTRADSWPTDIGKSSLWLAPWAPVRRRLTGRPVAQALTKRLTSKTSLVCSRW